MDEDTQLKINQILSQEKAATEKLERAKQAWRQETLAARVEMGKILRRVRGNMPTTQLAGLVGVPRQTIINMEAPDKKHARIHSAAKVMEIIEAAEVYSKMDLPRAKRGRPKKIKEII